MNLGKKIKKPRRNCGPTSQKEQTAKGKRGKRRGKGEEKERKRREEGEENVSENVKT